MFIYTVHCPALNEVEVCYTLDQANDLCWSMHEESNSFAWAEDCLGHTVAEYGDPAAEIADLVFNHQTAPCL